MIRKTVLFIMAMLSVSMYAQRQLFFYCPDERQGFHVASINDEDGSWHEIGKLFDSDYGPWGEEKRMYNPYILRASDGTWRAVFQVNDHAPCFAAVYSTDLITWRPQDYPRMSVRGCFSPIIIEKENGFDIHFASSDQGMRMTSATPDFRHFTPDRPADRVFKIRRDNAIVDGKEQEGQLISVPDEVVEQLLAWHAKQRLDQELSRETLTEDQTKLLPLLNTTNIGGEKAVEATLYVNADQEKPISDKLVGIFFEDISYAADGGLYAELIQNRDFEYNEKDFSRGDNHWTATTAWQADGEITVSTDQPLSATNPHHVVVDTKELWNTGWDGIHLKKGDKYNFLFYVRNIDKAKKQFTIVLRNKNGLACEPVSITAKGKLWDCYKAEITATQDCSDAVLAIIPKGKNRAAVDMVSLFPQDTYKGHGLRKDLAEAIAALHPKFVRFPGGCMTHGQGIDNIYHWHHSIGKWQDRQPDFNIWRYHQTRGLGFFEYFQWCEDMGAEPLPVLAAGVPCQNSAANADGYAGQQGGIPMSEMPSYIEEILNMIEWANGDPATSRWAKMRADAGHPQPFNLKYIGIGNEDIISTDFEERCLMICKAIRKRYPNLIICGTVGPFHDPSSDYVEGWKFAREHAKLFDLVDEHYYESTGWFLNNQHYYDQYDRQGPKVYLGEWASRSRTMESALVEAMHLCHVERNGDVVEMTSYAPLLCNEKHQNWNPDLIYFNNEAVTLTPSYETQRLFGTHDGDRYTPSVLDAEPEVSHRVATSIVRNSATGKTYLRLVNALPVSLSLHVPDVTFPSQPVYEGFCGQPADKTVTPITQLIVSDNDIQLPPYSVVNIQIKVGK